MTRLRLTVLLGVLLFAIVSIGAVSREQGGRTARGTAPTTSASAGLAGDQLRDVASTLHQLSYGA